jgi:hypothetical protein
VENAGLSRMDLIPSLPVPLGGSLRPPPWQSLLGNWIMFESTPAADGTGNDKVMLLRPGRKGQTCHRGPLGTPISETH